MADVAFESLEEYVEPEPEPSLNHDLRAVLAWADLHEIDLTQAQISRGYVNGGEVVSLYFFHHSETAENLRRLKRACGGLEPKGKPPSVTFDKVVQFGDTKILVCYLGAVECEVTYNCKPKAFKDGTKADGLVEDVFTRERVSS